MSSLDFIFLLQALSTLRACCNWLLSSRDLYGFHLVFYSSKSFLYGVFPSGAEYCFNMLRPYHVTCYKHTVYMYILQQYLWKGGKKKKNFLWKWETNRLPKEKSTSNSCFQQFDILLHTCGLCLINIFLKIREKKKALLFWNSYKGVSRAKITQLYQVMSKAGL